MSRLHRPMSGQDWALVALKSVVLALVIAAIGWKAGQALAWW